MTSIHQVKRMTLLSSAANYPLKALRCLQSRGCEAARGAEGTTAAADGVDAAAASGNQGVEAAEQRSDCSISSTASGGA